MYFRLLRNYLGPLWRRTTLLGVLLLLGVGLELLNPQIVRAFIDTAQAGGALETLARAAMLYIGIALVGQVIAVADTYFAESVGQEATNALRADLTAHCLSLDMPFHDAHTPGEMIERVDGDVAVLANFFSRFVLSLGASALMLIGVLVVLYREDWRIGAVFTVLSATALLAMERVRAMAARYVRARRQASADLIGFLEERRVGLPDVQANGAASYVLYRAEERLRTLFRTSRKSVVMGSLLGTITSAVFALGTIAVFALGGKTTMARLLLRLYNPQTGALRIHSADGRRIDIRDLAPDELQRRIGMVTQEVQLFRATVRDNLTLFGPSIPDWRILDALDELGLSGWLARLSRTGAASVLDIELAPGGSDLSAGEAQLLAFARVFLRDPRLVILDEASSRLDPATERLLERAVDGLLARRTAILIAHRVSTLQRADDIAILEDGRVVEHGARATLAAAQGSRFRALLEGATSLRAAEPMAIGATHAG